MTFPASRGQTLLHAGTMTSSFVIVLNTLFLRLQVRLSPASKGFFSTVSAGPFCGETHRSVS